HPDLQSFPTRRSSDLREPNASNAYTSIPSRSAAKAPAEVLCHDSESFYPCPGSETGRRAGLKIRPTGLCARLHIPVSQSSYEVRSEEHTSELQSRFDL